MECKERPKFLFFNLELSSLKQNVAEKEISECAFHPKLVK